MPAHSHPHHDPPATLPTARPEGGVRVLLLADTHLGFDLTLEPRVERVRRGPDFFANTERALEPALAGEVDLVVHGGDVFYRSKIPVEIARRGYEPFVRVARAGVPVVIVPGNHERSRLPHPLLAAYPNIHVLTAPRTICLDVRGRTVALAGFACVRDDVRTQFADALAATKHDAEPCDVRLLLIHQAFEGATVGPADYTFRDTHDVVAARDLPRNAFAAVLAGHIHRRQVLTHDLAGRPLAAPVLYPGSIERTSRAERDETKGYMIVDVVPNGTGIGRVAGYRFVDLPARPLIEIVIEATAAGNGKPASARDTLAAIRAELAHVPPRAVVTIRVAGGGGATKLPTAAALREIAPPDTVVTLRPELEAART